NTLPLSGQEGAEFYACSFQGAPVQVLLSLQVVRDIRRTLAQAVPSAATPSLKGVLLGNTVRPGMPKITDFRPIYSGSPAELEEAIAFAKRSGDDSGPIGYF